MSTLSCNREHNFLVFSKFASWGDVDFLHPCLTLQDVVQVIQWKMDGVIMRTMKPSDKGHKEPDYKVIVSIVFLRELVRSLCPILYANMTGLVGTWILLYFQTGVLVM